MCWKCVVLLQKHPTRTTLQTNSKMKQKKRGRGKTTSGEFWSLPLKYNHETLTKKFHLSSRLREQLPMLHFNERK